MKKKNAYGYERPRLRRPNWKKFVLGISALGTVVVAIGVAIVILWPDVAAQNIDRLRDIIGDAPVAQLEEMVLSLKDHTQQLEYNVGLVKPAAPWTDSPTVAVAIQPSPTLHNAVKEIPTGEAKLTGTPSSTITSSPTVTPLPFGVGVITATTAPYTPDPTSTELPMSAESTGWQLPSLMPLGNLAGEGQWSPYLFAADGKTTVAYRTFLQPDPQRPYSIPAIVAFNLQMTRLHFVLGTVEPIPESPQPSRTGAIPPADMRPGVLLATFNGGFKARHGQYGAMADGLIALPAITGLATVGMYSDGRVHIGEWGTDIQDSADLVAWRQNGEMLIHNGQINPATAQSTVSWGRTIAGSTITWRSALGMSADGNTLYYVVGLQLDAPTLAKAMARAGAAEALELDVNNYWVHFAAIRHAGSSLIAEPLIGAMNLQADRYLKSWSRDFFYITNATRP